MTVIIKVQTWIYIEVENEAQAEEACETLMGLDIQIAPGFPAGEILYTDVHHYERVGEQEVRELGLAAQ